jgi:hypothetical protein
LSCDLFELEDVPRGVPEPRGHGTIHDDLTLVNGLPIM